MILHGCAVQRCLLLHLVLIILPSCTRAVCYDWQADCCALPRAFCKRLDNWHQRRHCLHIQNRACDPKDMHALLPLHRRAPCDYALQGKSAAEIEREQEAKLAAKYGGLAKKKLMPKVSNQDWCC